ncbi:retrovirus-related Pol polyprotein from transposon TNT 1-94, partial [Trifolium pratense]
GLVELTLSQLESADVALPLVSVCTTLFKELMGSRNAFRNKIPRSSSSSSSMETDPQSESIPVNNTTTDLPNTNKESTKSGLPHPLTIKLDEKNFLLWSQQVNGVITAHNLHRFIVNPEIPLQFASVADRLEDGVLPRVLSCKHSYEVWEKIHTYFNSILKSRARQHRSELKNTKKHSRTVNEYLLRIKSIVNSLIVIGDVVSEREQVEVILEGLSEEFNPFVMMVYSRSDTPKVKDIEALLLLQESQFEKFRQELANPSVSANVAQIESKNSNHNSDSEGQDSGTEHYNVKAHRGRRRNKGRGRSRGKTQFTPNIGRVQ